jgi:hypothetical protein
MSKLTAFALVAKDETGRVIPGVLAILRAPEVPGGFLADITNADGYMVFNNVPVPFAGKLKMTGACAYYEQDVSITAEGATIRVGGPADGAPQDLHLPACVPFV